MPEDTPGPWPMFGATARHTGVGPGGRREGRQVWARHLSSSSYGGMAVDGKQRLFIGCHDGSLYSIETRTGKIRWRFDAGNPITSVPAVASDGVVYVGSMGGYFYALDGDDGSFRWAFDTKSQTFLQQQPPGRESPNFVRVPSGAVLGTDGTLVFGGFIEGHGSSAYKLLVPQGELVWSRNLRVPGSYSSVGSYACPVLAENGDVLFPLDGLIRLEGATGEEIWRYWSRRLPRVYQPVKSYSSSVPAYVDVRYGSVFHEPLEQLQAQELYPNPVYSSVSLGEDGSACFGDLFGFLYSVDAGSGKENWVIQLGDALSSKDSIMGCPIVGKQGLVYFGSDLRYYAVELSTGKQRWSIKLGGWVYGAPALDADGTLYIPCADGKLYAVDANTGSQLWQFHGSPNPLLSLGECIRSGRSFFQTSATMLFALLRLRSAAFAPAIIASPALGEDGLLFVSMGNEVYALR